MDKQTCTFLLDLAAGRIPEYIQEDCDYARELNALSAYHQGILNFAVAIAKGDLSASMGPQGGQLAGSLKALHASLRHLTWQTKQIAHGDLTQRVDFMGEFSEAFNSMVENLAEARLELTHMSTHDGMTGLYNRAYFDTELERAAHGRKFPVSIIMADLDGLKAVNDSAGHEAGDQLISSAAEILRESFRGDDVVARIGGDEFAVIMTNCSAEAAGEALKRIRGSQGKHNSMQNTAVSISLGAGTVECGEKLLDALKMADEQMYRDKAGNKSSRYSRESVTLG
jgi:diguanylate cyclase (GGDEF)-like protein